MKKVRLFFRASSFLVSNRDDLRTVLTSETVPAAQTRHPGRRRAAPS
jgi:hypothetical protein